MIYDSKEFNRIFDEFKRQRSWLNDISIEIVNGENKLPALDLLSAYEQEPTLENNLALASAFVLNKEVIFKKKDKVIHSFIYNGGDLSLKFEEAPWLLDMLLKMCFGIMVKKLTPPSEDSDNED